MSERPGPDDPFTDVSNAGASARGDAAEAAEAASATAGDGTQGPYRNLWVPLVVVPFLVVGVIVLVFVFFGAIRGKDASIEENLRRVVHGGANERKQAAVSLAAQVVENRAALAAGREPKWPVGPGFADEVQDAWKALPADDNANIRLALAELAASLGDPGALDKLSEFLALPDEADPRGELRVPAMLAVSWLGDERAATALLPFLAHGDPFLRQAAAAALQTVPGEKSAQALRGLLDDPALELRGQAAISLSRLGDDAGAGVLLELLDPATFERERAADARRFSGERIVHETRLEAVRALARLARPQDRALFERLASEDGDPSVREVAMLALRGGEVGQ